MKNALRFVLILLITAAAFFAGTFWKINHENSGKRISVKDLQKEQVTTFTEDYFSF